MTEADLQNLTKRFFEFRTALEIFPKKGLVLPFDDFPFGTCGDASLLLAKYFQNCGLGEFRYVSGTVRENGDFCSHAWLEKDGLIIDITADQFEEFDAPLIGSKKQNSWYRRFVCKDESPTLNDIPTGHAALWLAFIAKSLNTCRRPQSKFKIIDIHCMEKLR